MVRFVRLLLLWSSAPLSTGFVLPALSRQQQLGSERRTIRRGAVLQQAAPDDDLSETARRLPRVPDSTATLVGSASRSVTSAFGDGLNRQSLELFLPLEDNVKPEDLDPWPGGLRQMLNTALPIARSILEGVVPGCSVAERVISVEDSVVQLVAQGSSPKDDAVMVVFASPDHFDALREVEEACGDRLLILFNAQFDSAGELGFFKRGEPKVKSFFGPENSLKGGRFPLSYVATQTSCRSEDLRLCYEHASGWRAFVVADNVFDGQSLLTDGTPQPLHEGTLDRRPDYKTLESMVIAKLPSPVYMRRLKEATDLGPRFSREGSSPDDDQK